MSVVAQPLNPLTLPLTGLQMIEASAGTGKTWTLAALVVRLVLGHRAGTNQLGPALYPPQILVMTFTDAATGELRERIRARLAQAARFFQTGQAEHADAFLKQLHAAIDPSAWPECALRLNLAAQWMDEAAIFTIHGWSSRMLKTHAFDSASLFTQTRVTDPEQCQLTAVQDYWRQWVYALDTTALGAFDKLATTPQGLLAKLKDSWRQAERAPSPAAPAVAAPPEVLADWTRWQHQHDALQTQARAGWTAEVVALVQAAAGQKVLKNYRPDWLAGWLDKMAVWASGGALDADVLARFTNSTLVGKGWSQASNHPAFGQLQTLHDHLGQEPEVQAQLLNHAATEVWAAYQRAKAQAAQFDFSDLLQHLYHALQAPDGRLAQAIAAEYPVALVDEFQDTDPWQFGSLEKIYAQARTPEVGLVMIGDPKQAIYSFRGADLATYLRARAQAHGIYTLTGNYRATPALVAAVNHVFAQADAPFGEVPFEPVQPCHPDPQPLRLNGQPHVAMTVWHVSDPSLSGKSTLMAHLGDVFASQMVALLQAQVAQPGDMAVLVRDRFEAAVVRQALAQRGVRSVYLSERDSVFASPQAPDVWRVLRAVANPGNARLLRAALSTRLWGLDWPALHALWQDEAAWEAQVEQFMQLQRVWRTQGVLPMLHRVLHDQALAQRLLQQGAAGERALTNVLHLGEWLQAASTQLQGEGALLRHLETQLRQPSANAETAQLRLESDAQLVQVITLHKSKGLEYPLVFLPFASNFRVESGPSRSDDQRLEEDIRLLYVALTRAQRALWVGVVPMRGDVDGKTPTVKSAVARLLGRTTPADWPQCLQIWASEHIAVCPAPEPNLQAYTPTAEPRGAKGVRVAKRVLRRHWWSASFSALTRDLGRDQATDPIGSTMQRPGSAADERLSDALLERDPALWPQPPEPHPSDLAILLPEPATSALARFPAGSQVGTALHDLLQWQAEHGWPAKLDPDSAAQQAATEGAIQGTTQVAWQTSDSDHTAWVTLLAGVCQRLALTSDDAAQLGPWISRLVMTNWPLAHTEKGLVAINLGSLREGDFWPEMGFTLPVKGLSSDWLDQRIAQAVWPSEVRAPLQPRQLEGLVTGFMDLVFQHGGRYFVLDYKSNRLPDMTPNTLVQAMLAHRYDVQAVLYVLALHRLLKSRLPGYDYDTHMGGALYWFVRGVDQPGAGMLALPVPRELIDTLDAALDTAQSTTFLTATHQPPAQAHLP